MNIKSTLLLEHHLKELKLPTFLREYDKVASRCAAEGVDHPDYLLRLSELELIDRHHRMGEPQDQGGPLSYHQESGYLRLPGHTLSQQAYGVGVGPVRVHRP